jgi:hypothetical protein
MEQLITEKSMGVSKLYFDHVKMLCNIVVSLGKRPVLEEENTIRCC